MWVTGGGRSDEPEKLREKATKRATLGRREGELRKDGNTKVDLRGPLSSDSELRCSFSGSSGILPHPAEGQLLHGELLRHEGRAQHLPSRGRMHR